MDMAQKDNWSRSIEVDQEDVIGPNSCEQVGVSFVLDGRRSCAVVGRVVWSQKKFYDRYHGSLNEERGEAMAFGERRLVGGKLAFQLGCLLGQARSGNPAGVARLMQRMR